MLSNKTNKLTLTNNYLIVDKTGLKIPTYTHNGDIRHNMKFCEFLPNSDYSHKTYSGKKPIISPSEFDNKIIFVGANALAVEDVLKTTIATKHPGVDIQATILDNFLNNQFIVKFNAFSNLVTIILISIATFLIIRFFTFLPSLLTLIGFAILYFAFCIICFNNNIVPLVITPLAVQLSTMIFGYSYRFILAGKNKEKIKNG